MVNQVTDYLMNLFWATSLTATASSNVNRAYHLCISGFISKFLDADEEKNIFSVLDSSSELVL